MLLPTVSVEQSSGEKKNNCADYCIYLYIHIHLNDTS